MPGVYTVGVLEGSSALGMSQEEFEGLTGQEQQKELDRAKKILMDAGCRSCDPQFKRASSYYFLINRKMNTQRAGNILYFRFFIV